MTGAGMSAIRFGSKIASLAGLLTAFISSAAFAGGGGPCGTGTMHPIPEPAALSILGVGVAGILAARWRNRRKD